MRVVRLRAPGGPEQLAVEDAGRPRPGPGEALVRVHAAAITRGELEWPVDRLPAIPSYELSGVVEEVGPGGAGVAAGGRVLALTPFRPGRGPATRRSRSRRSTATASRPTTRSCPRRCWWPGRGRSGTPRARRCRCPRS